MKKILRSLFAFALLAAMLVSSLAPFGSASASPSGDANAPEVTPRVYIPAIFGPPPVYTVSGQVVDTSGAPLAGVTLTGSEGQSVTTDSNGNYSLQMPEGDNTILAAKSDTMFDPSVVEVDVNGDLNEQNFLACNQVINNNGFESGPPGLWWNLPDYGDVIYPIFPATPRYSWEWEYNYYSGVQEWVPYPVHSGVRVLRTGIPMHRPDLNQRAYSDGNTQSIYIPAGSASAWLTLWIYPVTTEPVVKPMAAKPEGDDFYNAPMASDAQYIRVLDAATGEQLEIIRWVKQNNPAWSFLAYDLTHWAGRSIKINVGTYNDGIDGFTVMYVDDVYFHICPPIAPPPPPPPPPVPCTERILNNSFEYTGGWYIPPTVYSAGYSSYFSHTGWRSMRTGIYYLAQNVYSYSDFGQAVYIPAGLSSATLKFYAYEMTSEPYSIALSAPPDPESLSGQFILSPDSSDVQYLLVLNQWQSWIGTLLWQKVNQPWWGYYQYNLMGYQGSTIRLQWGTYNNGYSGVTSMYIDDVTLVTCP